MTGAISYWNSDMRRRSAVLTAVVVLGLLFCLVRLRRRQNVNLTAADIVDEIRVDSVWPKEVECRLAHLDPWDPSLAHLMDPLWHPLPACRPRPALTELVRGRLVLREEVPKGGSCFHRCLNPVNDVKLAFGDWHILVNNSAVPCDVVEVRCVTKSWLSYFRVFQLPVEEQSVFYQNLHAHTFRTLDKQIKPKPTRKPDVHLIVLDAVSMSQLFRSLPRTVHLLRETFGAVPFPHLNKNGLNSRPNGFAFLLGKRVEEVLPSPITSGIPSDYRNASDCTDFLDGDRFVAFQFRDAGYVTLMSEDWVPGVFDWPNCRGHAKPPTHHYMRPFQLRLTNPQFGSSELHSAVMKQSCRESFQSQMEYLQSFLDTYPDRPKFSITWMSELAHDNANGLYHADDYFYNFFQHNRAKFANSHIFLMGDHGIRYGAVRREPLGELEDANPALLMIPPETLRDENKLHVMRENAKQLVSHFDIHATLVQLAQSSDTAPNASMTPGNSLFHPLPPGRSCGSMGIAFEYCLCRPRQSQLAVSDVRTLPAAEAVLRRLNSDLAREPVSRDRCARLRLDPKRPPVVKELHLTSAHAESVSDTLLHVTVWTLPGTGEFAAIVTNSSTAISGRPEFVVTSAHIARNSIFRDEALCVPKIDFISYCYCKDLL